MRHPRIEKVIAQIEAERAIVDKCVAMLAYSTTSDASESAQRLQSHSDMLSTCIAHLRGTTSPEAPKPTRGRKTRIITQPRGPLLGGEEKD